MSEDDLVLSAAWRHDRQDDRQPTASAVEHVLEKDRADRERERRVRFGSLWALACLVPVTLWAAAHGVTPLVRGAYALMAVGSAVGVSAEWLYLDWSRQALPGPADVRSQLQRTAFTLTRQIMLMRTAPIWASPVFIGVAMIGLWLYRSRSHAEAFVIWVVAAGPWLLLWFGAATARSRFSERKRQMEQLLNQLQ